MGIDKASTKKIQQQEQRLKLFLESLAFATY